MPCSLLFVFILFCKSDRHIACWVAFGTSVCADSKSAIIKFFSIAVMLHELH